MDLHAENQDLVPVLRTSRLVLKPLVTDDLDDVVRLCGDYDVSKMLVPVPHPYSRSDAEDFLAMDQRGAVGMLWMIHDATGLCGAVSIGKELGYWLGRPAWGQGYMTEAAQAAVDCYFNLRLADQIASSHFVENTASSNVLEKLGFVDTGPHLHFSTARQCDVQGRGMLLTRDVWQARHV